MSKGHEETFFQGRYLNGQQAHKRMFNIIKSSGKCKPKPQTRCHFISTFISTRMANIKKTDNNKGLVKMRRNGNFHLLLMGM